MKERIISNLITTRGIHCPIVARTFIQGKEIVKLCFFKDKKKEENILKSIINLLKRLSACADHLNTLEMEINKVFSKIKRDLNSNKLNKIENLNKISEHFIDEAYLASKDIGNLIRHLFNHNITSVKYDKVIEWAIKSGHLELSHLIEQANEKFLRKIRDLRTSRHHPENPKYNFSIINIQKMDEGILLPSWQANEYQPCLIHKDMNLFIYGLLELQECVLLLGAQQINPRIDFKEIPPESRNPNCPLRFNLFFLGSQVKGFAPFNTFLSRPLL